VKVIYALTSDGEQTASTRPDRRPAGYHSRFRLNDAQAHGHLRPGRACALPRSAPDSRRPPSGAGVIRRHRLLELFLATSLEIPWEDVHRYADALEHAVSDDLVELIAAKLGDPVADPHGDPIPNRALEVDEHATPSLADLDVGQHAIIVRVSDSDPAMLRYLTEQEIAIGDRVHLLSRQRLTGPARSASATVITTSA